MDHVDEPYMSIHPIKGEEKKDVKWKVISNGQNYRGKKLLVLMNIILDENQEETELFEPGEKLRSHELVSPRKLLNTYLYEYMKIEETFVCYGGDWFDCICVYNDKVIIKEEAEMICKKMLCIDGKRVAPFYMPRKLKICFQELPPEERSI